VYTWIELIAELANAAKDMPALRAALPPGFGASAELKATLQQHLPQYLEQPHDNRFPALDRRLRAPSDVRVIGLQTQLKAPEAGRHRISMEKRGAILEFEGRESSSFSIKFGPPSMTCARGNRSGQESFLDPSTTTAAELGAISPPRTLPDVGRLNSFLTRT
ncbi:MAG: hypothetical protein ACLPXW_10505, partial [Xanthobacteraceae bacterium]